MPSSSSLCDRFYRKLLGVTPLAPGYARVSIKPTGIGHANLSHAAARVATPRGDVAVNVASNTSVLTLAVELPPGATARVSVPLHAAGGARANAATATIAEGGAPIWRSGKFVPGVAGVSAAAPSVDGAYVEFEVASGAYAFSSA